MLTAMTGPGESSPERLLAFPGMRRVAHEGIALFVLKHFLSPVECAGLVERIDQRRQPSTLADANGDAYFRTSETSHFDHADPLVRALDWKLAWISGIDPTHGEPLQGQRYAQGQEFKPHTDYFEPDGADYARYCSVSGQRTWTFMVYLNDVSAGGGTRFVAINRTFQPERGTMLAWNNRGPDGQGNPLTMHHGLPVRKGTKYIVTRWYRERPWG